MRPILLAAALALASGAALAQTPAAGDSGTPAASSRPATERTGRSPYRQSLPQRFEAANTTKDGHLTKAQAEEAHWTYLSRNFDAIDKSHQGYVTVQDIRAYARERRAARQAASSTAHG
ncbi:MAG: hypothetical protein JOY70_01315 [Acidisphaera sp.]|nr:hypothetical protein [Acidisphaera sp.]MBV9813015.1 hypothetical protein [Acetobacteraceae bacterium]